MKHIDFNNINYEQLLELLPVLQMSYFFGIEDPEIFLLLLPVWNDDAGEVIEHVVCGYVPNEGGLIICPLGTLKSHHPVTDIWDGHESLFECICLATGRFDGGNKLAFSSILGRLSYDESQGYMPCQIQAAGEAIFSRFFGDQNFCTTVIGGRSYCKTEYLEEGKSSNPFSTVQVAAPPM